MFGHFSNRRAIRVVKFHAVPVAEVGRFYIRFVGGGDGQGLPVTVEYNGSKLISAENLGNRKCAQRLLVRMTVLFTTVRKFKGLEADTVICVDVDATTFETDRNRNAFYVGSSRAKLFLEVLSVLPSDDDVIDMANSISSSGAHNRMRALGMIANGLKVKIETDIEKHYR